MRILKASILLYALYINLNASNDKTYSYHNNSDSSQVDVENTKNKSYKRNSRNKFIFDFQFNAFYITNKYEFIEIQFNIVPMFNKNVIVQIGTTYGTGETNKISISSQNIKHTVCSYLFGIGGLIHFRNQEFILLFNYAEKDYITNQGCSSKINRSADYFALYDNIGIGQFRFLAGVKYFIKNISIQGKEEKLAASIGVGLNI